MEAILVDTPNRNNVQPSPRRPRVPGTDCPIVPGRSNNNPPLVRNPARNDTCDALGPAFSVAQRQVDNVIAVLVRAHESGNDDIVAHSAATAEYPVSI